jgi:hypothetical protein
MQMSRINRSRILECLEELSNRQLQENLWMGKIPSKQSSFVEAVEGLFTDSGLSDELSSGRSGVSKEAELKLRELEDQVARVHAKGGPASVISDPAMPRVRELAVGVLELLKHEMK